VARLDAALRRADPEAAARFSSAIPVEQVKTVRPVLTRSLARLRSGNRILLGDVEEPYRPDLRSRLDDALSGLDQPSAEALVAYLRHRGQWEAAARELTVHRNTMRHRIARCEAVMGVDLTDPDVAAELWLLLRRRGAA
jgi:purine catabolism regulator